MKRKKILALVLSCSMIFSNFTGFTVFAAEDEAQEYADVIIDVTDYGADPTGKEDSAKAIQKALNAAKKEAEEGKSIRIEFPTGRYDIYPDYAAERELYISNTVGADQRYKNKKIGILVEDMDNVTIDGNGSLFMYHGKMTTFAAIDSEDVLFTDFKVDFQVPTVVDITAESVNGNKAVIYVPERYRYEINGNSITWKGDESPYTGQTYWSGTNSFNYCQIFDTKEGLTWRGGSPFSGVSSIRDLGNNRLEFTYNGNPSVTEGYCYQMRPTVRDHAGTFFWKSKDVELNNLDIYFLHGFGMVGQHSENITLNDVDFETPAEQGRTTAGYADFIQMSGCKGKIDIQNCTFSNPHDDPINIHGTFNQVVEKIADNKIKVRYRHGETAGFPNFFVGNQVEFMTQGNMIPVADSVRTVTAVDGPDGKGGDMGEGSGSLTDIILTFDEAIPAEVGVNSHVVENITYTPSVLIKNNVFKETPTRGILVTTRQPIVIEENLFDGLRMPSIYISNDAQGWYESGPTRDVTIRNNTFTRGKSQAILVEPTNPTVSTTQTVHENMTIEGNTFFMENQRALDAKSVKNLTFKNNKIYRQNPDVAITASANETEMEVGTSQILSVESGAASLSNRLYRFNGCKNVVVEGNIYDGGMNVGSDYTNMSADEITVTEDSMLVGVSKQTESVGKVYYESSNNNVVTVSSNGTVTAVGEGEAEVTVYSIAGGRRYDGNTITFTVNGASQAALPTGIEINAPKELTRGEQVAYTAEIFGEENVDKTVAWSVVDVETGAESSIASIDENGVLTPIEGGIVEVVARTVNGLEARKLLAIQIEPAVLADNFTMEFDNSDKWELLEDGSIEMEFVDGGLYQEQKPANVLVGDAGLTGDYEVEVKAKGTTTKGWSAFGLYLYNDQNNYVSVERKHRGGTTRKIALVREENQRAGETWLGGSEGACPTVDDDVVYLKLAKKGNTITASYRPENSDEYIQVGSTTADFIGDDTKVALTALGETSGAKIVFSDLKVNGEAVSFVGGGKTDAGFVLAENVAIEGENAETWSVEGEDRIHVSTPAGATFNDDGAAPVNIFKVPIGTDVQDTTVTMKIEGNVKTGWEDTGLYLYKDSDNYTSIQKKYRGSYPVLGLVNEIAGNGDGKNGGKGGEQLGNQSDYPAADDFDFKLEKAGNEVSAYYSVNNTEWTKFGNTVTNETLSSGDLYVAFTGCSSKPGSPHVYTELYVGGTHVPLTRIAGLPTVSDVHVDYIEAENRLTASYQAAETGKEIVKWAAADTEDGNYSVLANVTGEELISTPEMKGKFVKAAVVPVALSGLVGEIAWSDAVEVTGEGEDGGAGSVASSNAMLATAEISSLNTPFETFDKGALYYHTTAGVDETSVHVNFAAEHKEASVEVTANGKVIDADADVELASGRNTIEATVTAPDKVTKRVYRFTISRTGDNRAELESLTADETEINLEDGKTEYSYIVEDSSATELTIKAVAASSRAVTEMFVDGAKLTDGKVDLSEGTKSVIIRVTPETTDAPMYYTLHVKIPNPASANLASMEFGKNAELNEAVNGSVTEYTASATADEIAFTAAAAEDEADIEVSVNGEKQGEAGKGSFNGTLQFNEGENTILVKIVSPNKETTKNYTITVTVTIPPVTQIADEILRKNAVANSEQLDINNNDGPAAWAFDDDSHWWHSRWDGTPTDHEVASGQVSPNNPIWIQTGFDKVEYVKEITYLPRQDQSTCRIRAYEVQTANLADPKAESTDADFKTVKSGELANTGAMSTIQLDEAVPATHIRIVTKSVHSDNGTGFVTAQRIKIYAATLKNITVTEPTKTEYKVGEDINLDGMQVIAHYSDGMELDVTNEVEVSGFDSAAAGEKTITVTYKGKKAAFTITVKGEGVPGELESAIKDAKEAAAAAEAAKAEAERKLAEAKEQAAEAATKAADAEKEAKAAATAADTAATKAQEAKTAQERAEAAAKEVASIKEDKQAAENAKRAAEDAKTAAEKAQKDAADAADKAKEAQKKAVDAKEEAVEAQDAAEAAKKDAEKAKGAAETAAKAAAKAEEDAFQAKKDAEAAQGEAEAAAKGAAEAAADAEKANKAAGEAKAAAEKAAEAAETAQKLAETQAAAAEIAESESKAYAEKAIAAQKAAEEDAKRAEEIRKEAEEELKRVQEEAEKKLEALREILRETTKERLQKYSDFQSDSWYEDYVVDVYISGYMTGMNADYFGVNETLVRAQFAVILYRMAGEPEVEFKDNFADVKDGQFYSDAVTWASEEGIITGYEDSGLFGANDKITREQMATIMYRYADVEAKDEKKEADADTDEILKDFPDAEEVSEFAKEALAWCVEEEIITGKTAGEEKLLAPQGDTLRAECAAIISRFAEWKNAK